MKLLAAICALLLAAAAGAQEARPRILREALVQPPKPAASAASAPVVRPRLNQGDAARARAAPPAAAARAAPPPPPPAPPPLAVPDSAPAGAPPPVTASAEPRRSGFVYPLWYGTNRQPVMNGATTVGYSARYTPTVQFGKVLVDIPEDFLKAPSWLSLFRTAEKRIRVRTPQPLEQEDFFRSIQEHLRDQPEREGVIYLHGFNTTWVEAAQRAAAIGFHLKMPLTIFYSWPSQGGTSNYVADLTLVERSEEKIARFLIEAVRKAGATRLHLIAHSMGNEGLLRAMLTPLMAEAMRQDIRFGQIILAAPDVDKDYFNEKGDLYTRIADRVTLYASSNDVALNASKKLRPHLDRAGLMPPPVHVQGVDVVDVGEVNLTLLGHAYVSSEIRVLHDMFSLIKDNMPPQERLGVMPFSREPGKNTHWVLR
jgi:esterase/lipase superfamily enzyme